MFLIAHFIPPKNNNSVTTISNSSDNDFFPLMYFLWGGKFSENSFTQIYVSPGWGGGGVERRDSHMEQTGMLVVSLRGVNLGFSSCLGCSGHSTNILSRQETQNYAKRNRCQIFFLTCFVFVCVFKGSLLGVKICLSHGQIDLL